MTIKNKEKKFCTITISVAVKNKLDAFVKKECKNRRSFTEKALIELIDKESK